MNRLSAEMVESYLVSYGWSYHVSSDRQWVTGWQGEFRSYPMVISLTETWLLLEVKPLVRVDADWETWPEIMRHILELNNDCQMIKLSLDEFGDIVLSIQLFTSNVSFEIFSDALGVLGHYSEQLFDDLSSRLGDLGYLLNIPQEYLT